MRGYFWVLAVLTFIESSQSSCTPVQFTTITILETPTAYVRLEADPAVDREKAHSHPLSLSAERMAAALSGIIIQEPLGRLPFYDDISQPRRHPAFTEKEVLFFASLLTMALSKATPEEVITFYQSRTLSGTSREVTSGGLFVQGDELHFILANNRSPTHYSADIGVTDTTDDRLTPMQPLAPQRGRLDFEPRTALQPVPSSGWTRYLQTDRRELIILFRQLTLRPLNQAPSEIPPSGDIGR